MLSLSGLEGHGGYSLYTPGWRTCSPWDGNGVVEAGGCRACPGVGGVCMASVTLLAVPVLAGLSVSAGLVGNLEDSLAQCS